MRIVRQLSKFVQKISVGLRASDCRFVGDVLLGVVQRGSTMLTEIGRALKEPCKLKHTEKRLSRMASSKYFDDERLLTNYLSEVGRLTASKLPYVAVDLTDIAKPSGKTMEGLGLVRDGSSSKKGGSKKAANIVHGYEVFEATATHPDHHLAVPLMTEPYSTTAAEFKSQNEEIEMRLRYLAPFIACTAIWLFDRGFDRRYILNTVMELGLNWVVRMVGNRNVEFGEGPKRMDVLAKGLRLRHSVLVHTRTKGSKDIERKVHFTYIPVHLRDIEGQRGLVVVHMGGRKRMMLLTWRVPKSSAEAAQWIQAYLRRWSVEDSARACKQLVGIEDVRVQSLRAIVRLVRLAAIALGWLCLRVLFAPKTVAKILALAKTVGREPLYLVYRLLEGIRHPA